MNNNRIHFEKEFFKNKQKGFVLIFVVIISVIIYIIAISLCGFVIGEKKSAKLAENETIAFYLADAGIEYARAKFKEMALGIDFPLTFSPSELLNKGDITGSFSVEQEEKKEVKKDDEYEYRIKSVGKFYVRGILAAQKTVKAQILVSMGKDKKDKEEDEDDKKGSEKAEEAGSEETVEDEQVQTEIYRWYEAYR